MRRRELVALVFGFISAPLTVGAQQSGKVYRVGVLSPADPVLGLLERVREGLRGAGYMRAET